MIPLFLCWGSFLNVLAFRLVLDRSIITPRSFCPQCSNTLAWHDNVPLLSWFFLKGRCRYCKKSISVLYPLIELFTAIILSLLYIYIPHTYFLSYFIFFSALIVTIRSDIETMLISRFMTLFLVPVGIILSSLGLLPLYLLDSIIGAIIGYFFLFFIGFIFEKCTGKTGIGEGDFDLLSFIGAFTGITGCWVSLTIGSFTGSLFGLVYLLITEKKDTKIPFGPFLALGAIIFVFYQKEFYYFLTVPHQ